MTSKPRWRQIFDKVERKVGVPLEDAVASKRFVEVLSVGIKVRRAAGGTVRRAVHGVTGKVLHAVNIPTGDDVKRLSANLGTLAGEIRAIEQGQRTAESTTNSATNSTAQPARPATRNAAVRAVKPTSTTRTSSGEQAGPVDD